jgi:hypothetical protein
VSHGGSREVPAQPLRPRLADMQRSPDSSYRRNAVSRQVSREHNHDTLAQRIGGKAIVTRVVRIRWQLPAADDRHQELVRADQVRWTLPSPFIFVYRRVRLLRVLPGYEGFGAVRC